MSSPKNWVLWLLWKITGRDCLVLNPAWSLLHRSERCIVTGPKGLADPRLPVVSPFHLKDPWQIEYHVLGEGPGMLQYSLGEPDAPPFCLVQETVSLPMIWKVERRGPEVQINGVLHTPKSIPARIRWLCASFSFQPEGSGRSLVRHLGHHVPPSNPTDAEYFTGAAYKEYETDAGFNPETILDSIHEARPLAGRFLDIGCATGFLVQAALRRGLEAEGIDVSPWAIERANARVPGRCRVLDIEGSDASAFPAGYDVVTLHSVIEHFAEPEKVLRLIFEITRPGGVVFIQTLNARSLTHRLLEENWVGFSDYTHKSPWITMDWLQAAGVRAGFEVLRARTCGLWTENPGDDVWSLFAEVAGTRPFAVLFAEGLGDVAEIMLLKK